MVSAPPGETSAGNSGRWRRTSSSRRNAPRAASTSTAAAMKVFDTETMWNRVRGPMGTRCARLANPDVAPRDDVGAAGHRHRDAGLAVALRGEAFDALEEAVGAQGGHRGPILPPPRAPSYASRGMTSLGADAGRDRRAGGLGAIARRLAGGWVAPPRTPTGRLVPIDREDLGVPVGRFSASLGPRARKLTWP